MNIQEDGYLEYTEDNRKCYLESKNQIVGFEADSKKIYKTKQNPTTDYIYLDLKNNIIINNSILYIALDDLNQGLNVLYEYIQKDNIISINTYDFVLSKRSEQFEQNSLSVSSNNFKNNQAISYGMYVVTGDNRKMGVVDQDLQTLIGNRYLTIEFDEYTQNFIVSGENNKYGIITKTGNQIVELIYDSIEIINYSPLLYKVKYNNSYGVINKDGQIVVNIEYSNIGIDGKEKGEKILIIEDLVDNQDAIVVNKDGKYGLINLKTQNEIVQCVLDKIYYKNDNNKIEYYVQINDGEALLQEYLKYLGTLEVNL